VPQGFVVEEFAQQIDVLPTVLHLIGLDEETPAVHGRALLRSGRATAGPPFVIAERFRPDLEGLRRRLRARDLRLCDVRERAIRTRREKYIWRSDEANELYDLVQDPGERRNLMPEGGDRARPLRGQLFDWLASVERFTADDAGVAEEGELCHA
jgi:arylsulfatase A-like enzyme